MARNYTAEGEAYDMRMRLEPVTPDTHHITFQIYSKEGDAIYAIEFRQSTPTLAISALRAELRGGPLADIIGNRTDLSGCVIELANKSQASFSMKEPSEVFSNYRAKPKLSTARL